MTLSRSDPSPEPQKSKSVEREPEESTPRCLYMRRINIESPYAGDVEENIKYARRCIQSVINQGDSPFASHLLYPQCLNDKDPAERRLGMKCGFEWMYVAHQSVLFVDRGISDGMKQGEKEAERWFVPLAYKRLDPLPKPFYVRISGKRCAGKDTLACLLQRYIPSATILGFADILKREYAATINPTLVEMIVQRLKTEYSYKEDHRQGLIDMGRREKDRYGEDVWVRKLESATANSGMVIVPDMRFRYEFQNEIFSKLNSITIRVNATVETRSGRGWRYDEKIDTHETEVGLDDEKRFDVVVRNDSTTEALRVEAEKIVKRYCLGN